MVYLLTDKGCDATGQSQGKDENHLIPVKIQILGPRMVDAVLTLPPVPYAFHVSLDYFVYYILTCTLYYMC